MLPVPFVLGCFTIARLIDTSVANIISQRRMELIRHYYAALTPAAPPYFAADDSVGGNHGVRYNRSAFLFTMASMVIVVNSALGGATAALIGALALKAPIGAATARFLADLRSRCSASSAASPRWCITMPVAR